MSKLYEHISPELAEWIGRQKVFFVATAPLAADGHVNCSPKGGASLRVLGPLEVAYQDLHGSGAETAAHLRENGRMVVMLCAFEGEPQILRLHGRGEVVPPGQARFGALQALFPEHSGTRSFIRLAIDRIADSCGWGVPVMAFQSERDGLDKWARSKGEQGLAAYRAQKNAVSIDGLAAFER